MSCEKMQRREVKLTSQSELLPMPVPITVGGEKLGCITKGKIGAMQV